MVRRHEGARLVRLCFFVSSDRFLDPMGLLGSFRWDLMDLNVFFSILFFLLSELIFFMCDHLELMYLKEHE
jgi:hypothetical protein